MNQHFDSGAALRSERIDGQRGVTLRCVREGVETDVIVPLSSGGAERPQRELHVGQLIALTPRLIASAKDQIGEAGDLTIAGVAYDDPRLEVIPFRVCYSDSENKPYVVDVAARTAAGALFSQFWAHASAMARPETDEAGFMAWIGSLNPIMAVEVPTRSSRDDRREEGR